VQSTRIMQMALNESHSLIFSGVTDLLELQAGFLPGKIRKSFDIFC
jgi:hypothetical protein